MNDIIYKQSLSSYNILIKLFGNGRVKLNSKMEVLLDGMVLLDDESHKLILYNTSSKKLRRKNKSEYKYLNFYSDCSKLVDYFLSEFNEYESIDISKSDELTYLVLKKYNNNKNVNENETCILKTNNRSTNYMVTLFIKEFLDNNSNY